MRMNEAMGIGFFQFDNLVRNRVPFALVLEAVDFSVMFQGQDLDHLKKYGMVFDPQVTVPEIVLKLQSRHYQADDPVILLCAQGNLSKVWATQLVAMGFKNCYFVEGGFAALLKGFHESQSS